MTRHNVNTGSKETKTKWNCKCKKLCQIQIQKCGKVIKYLSMVTTSRFRGVSSNNVTKKTMRIQFDWFAQKYGSNCVINKCQNGHQMPIIKCVINWFAAPSVGCSQLKIDLCQLENKKPSKNPSNSCSRKIMCQTFIMNNGH